MRQVVCGYPMYLLLLKHQDVIIVSMMWLTLVWLHTVKILGIAPEMSAIGF